jgi:hypothetical protein
MNERNRRAGYVIATLAVLCAGVLAEAGRLVTPWPGFAPLASRTVSILLIVLWATSALLLPLRNRPGKAGSSARILAIAAPFAMLAHAGVTRVGGSMIGLAYAGGAIVLTLLLGNLFAGERVPAHRRPAGNVLRGELANGPPSASAAT